MVALQSLLATGLLALAEAVPSSSHALAALGAPSPTRPALLKTFSANMTSYSYGPGTGNMTAFAQPIAVSEAKQSILNVEIAADGRAVQVVFDYHNDSRAGIFSLQPFFDEHVCFIFPPEPVPKEYNPFEIGVEFLWFNQAWSPDVMTKYEASVFNGSKTVAGQPCDVWRNAMVGPAESDIITWCVQRDTGGLLEVARTQHVPDPRNKSVTFTTKLHGTFAHFVTTVSPTAFKVPAKGCADMRPIHDDAGHGSAQGVGTTLNDPTRIDAINRQAAGSWVAGPSAVWEGKSAEDVVPRLGLHRATVGRRALPWRAQPLTADAVAHTPARPLHALKLELPSEAHRRARSAAPLPKAWDTRTAFPACGSVHKIRNQGECGSCWAFAGTECLADRFCVAGAQKGGASATAYNNLTLSPEYFMDCDLSNAACGGGLIDDAWEFLESSGLPADTCDPYLYCAHPVSPSCETGPHPARPAPHLQVCPKTCMDGSGAPKLFQMQNAYAVATPADAVSMQQELMAHGPFEVGFQVFEDFMSYHNGTYSRTAGSPGPKGGHAVKIVGWGVDEEGVDYWTVANSWSADWGMGGFFNIRRGTNECGIETTPAAGVPKQQI